MSPCSNLPTADYPHDVSICSNSSSAVPEFREFPIQSSTVCGVCQAVLQVGLLGQRVSQLNTFRLPEILSLLFLGNAVNSVLLSLG